MKRMMTRSAPNFQEPEGVETTCETGRFAVTSENLGNMSFAVVEPNTQYLSLHVHESSNEREPPPEEPRVRAGSTLESLRNV